MPLCWIRGDELFLCVRTKRSQSLARQTPYIGKGGGSRAYDHLGNPDGTRKYQRIREIQNTRFTPIVEILVDDLNEPQALKLEAELIAAFGTEDTGGILTNSVVPSALVNRKSEGLIVPHGALERAQLGLELLKSAILAFAQANVGGITNSNAASTLGLRSDNHGRQKDYLTYSVLGLLLREGRLTKDPATSRHKAVDHLL
jgi:hypothetical protein